MKKILVTGCNGFLGRNICARFTAMGYAVSGIDIAGTPQLPLAGFLQASITPETLEKLGETFDVIIHLAGPGTVSAANQDGDAVSRRVLDNMRAILESTRRYPDTLVLYPSSAAVYGDQLRSPLSEDMPSAPLSRYGCNKVADEELAGEYHRHYGSRVVLIRFFSIYGPGLRKQLLWDFSQRLFEAKRSGRRSIPCFGTGDETRDYLHIDDVVRIFEFFCRKSPDWAVVNAGSGTARSVREVLTALVRAYALDMTLDFDGIIRQGNPMHMLADVTRLRESGFVPSVPFETGIAGYADWAKKELFTGED